MSQLQQSDYRIRKLIGILGLALPFVLPLAAGDVLSSISHNYYLTVPSLIFIITLSTMGLFLISYKGYRIDGTGEKEVISDDLITNIGGLAALVVVIVPTCCVDSLNETVNLLCEEKTYPLLGHDNTIKNIIHLASAGIFIFAMGWMSIYKFTRGSDKTSNEYRIFKWCGYFVWGSIGVLLVYMALTYILDDFFVPRMVYIMETVAIVPFGISWLVKGKTMTYLKSLMTTTQSEDN